jgi:hypothetical protein
MGTFLFVLILGLSTGDKVVTKNASATEGVLKEKL